MFAELLRGETKRNPNALDEARRTVEQTILLHPQSSRAFHVLEATNIFCEKDVFCCMLVFSTREEYMLG